MQSCAPVPRLADAFHSQLCRVCLTYSLSAAVAGRPAQGEYATKCGFRKAARKRARLARRRTLRGVNQLMQQSTLETANLRRRAVPHAPRSAVPRSDCQPPAFMRQSQALTATSLRVRGHH